MNFVIICSNRYNLPAYLIVGLPTNAYIYKYRYQMPWITKTLEEQTRQPNLWSMYTHTSSDTTTSMFISSESYQEILRNI